jgi:uncharacterized protein (DUF697 family)
LAPRLPFSLAALRRLMVQVAAAEEGEHVLAVGGASDLAPVLRQQFFRGGADPAAVRLGGPEGADVYVHVLIAGGEVSGEPGRVSSASPTTLAADDVTSLRRASRARVPVVAVVAGATCDDLAIPYVLATDVVAAGESFPLELIAHTIAARLGERGAPLAARVPLLRQAVCEQLVESFARRNALLAAAAWVPGRDLPVLTLNEIRLVLRLAQAYGEDSGRERLPELLATLGAGFGLRALARELFERVPVGGWVVKTAVAYGGTLTLGRAARRRFELAPTPRPRASAARAAP